MGKKKLTNKIARIENFFIENAQYLLNAREQKIILHLAANLDLDKDDFHEQIIPVKDLEQMLKQTQSKWGGIYTEMSDFAERIVGKKIKFPTDILLNGQALPGFVTWFSGIAPCYNEADEVCLKFRFNPDLKPFLLKLNQYVRINLTEISKLNSFYSLRLYQIFKANLAKRRSYVKIISKTYPIGELREILGAKNKYDEFKYFKRDILVKAVEEINEFTQIYVKYEAKRTRRKVTHIEFIFCEKEDHNEFKQLSFLDDNYVSPEIRTDSQKRARSKAFNFEDFKKHFPLIYRQKVKEVKKAFLDEGFKELPNKEKYIQQSIENACQNWFTEYA
jgi:plasmid replication initiation protein